MTRRRFTLLALGIVIIGLLVWTGPTLWTAAMTEMEYVRTAEDRIHIIQRHRFQHTSTAIFSVEFLADGRRESWSSVAFDETPLFWRGLRVHSPEVAPWQELGVTLDKWWDALPDHQKVRE